MSYLMRYYRPRGVSLQWNLTRAEDFDGFELLIGARRTARAATFFTTQSTHNVNSRYVVMRLEPELLRMQTRDRHKMLQVIERYVDAAVTRLLKSMDPDMSYFRAARHPEIYDKYEKKEIPTPGAATPPEWGEESP